MWRELFTVSDFTVIINCFYSKKSSIFKSGTKMKTGCLFLAWIFSFNKWSTFFFQSVLYCKFPKFCEFFCKNLTSISMHNFSLFQKWIYHKPATCIQLNSESNLYIIFYFFMMWQFKKFSEHGLLQIVFYVGLVNFQTIELCYTLTVVIGSCVCFWDGLFVT